ncbi:MAG: PEP-CTERM-box response regulator transcription factor [Alphaproteobacteria bacterium]|nr:PEP-CTERM-box response regulator transcription factor [Alphaproteobacteria bacterium]MCB9929121.1 PEP-CTERM-box response regulator transcription factor [Alphaproteobacteria bacterium]
MAVDDDPGIQRSLRWCFDDYEVITAGDRATAIQAMEATRPAVVTLDLGLPPSVDDATEGLATLAAILAIAPTTKVIVVSGNEDHANAVRAIAEGAYDFYSKPIDEEVLQLIVRRAFHVHELEAENRSLRTAKADDHGILTASESMQAVCKMVEKIAPTDATVLLLGESGTGKELLARALHRRALRDDGPFVAINCAAIPENLLESELFGHEKGAFTGAIKALKGKIELADGGTLFLDEIGDMPPSLQGKLLRFLQEREIERIGGRDIIPVDVRVVSATHRDLRKLIDEGTFREDLFYRLAEIVVEIPPLRDRGDDSVLLAQHFATRFAAQMNSAAVKLSADAADAIRAYKWRGNVRELENRVKRAVIMANQPVINASDLDLPSVTPRARAAFDGPAEIISLRDARERAEREAITIALRSLSGNLSAVAKALGVSRPTLYNLLKQHDLNADMEEGTNA